MKISLLLISFFISHLLFAASLTEKKLLEDLQRNSGDEQYYPLELWSNETYYYQTLIQTYSNQLLFSPELYSQLSYAETKQKPIISFQPVFSPERSFELGVKQLLPYGLSWNLYGSTIVQDANGRGVSSNFKHISTTVVGLNLEIDLWKDFGGNGMGLIFQESVLEENQAALEKSNNDKRYILEIRELYWSIVATNESIELMESLIQIADKQLKESVKRRKNSLADADEVSRYESQLLGRKSELSFKQFQREKMFQELKKRVRSLQNQELKFEKENIELTQSEVLSCIKEISQIKDIPLDATNLDEQILVLSEIQKLQTRRYSKSSDLDLKLFGGIRSTGVDSNLIATNQYQGNQSESWNDLYQNDRWGSEIGLRLTLPLGQTNKKHEEALVRQSSLQKEIQLKEKQESLQLHHQQFKKMIGYLEEGVGSQAAQTQSLKNVIKSMEQKYRQARVTLTDLLQNQDAHYSAELRTIDARLEIVVYLLNYLKIFPETKCNFNRH